MDAATDSWYLSPSLFCRMARELSRSGAELRQGTSARCKDRFSGNADGLTGIAVTYGNVLK